MADDARASNSQERAAADLRTFKQQQAEHEVRVAQEGVLAAEARYVAAKESLTAAEESKRLREARHREGLAPLIAHVTRGMGPGSDCGATHHNVGNFRVTVAGDSATSKANFYAVHEGINHCAGEHYSCWGEYDDEWVRTDHGWRVSRRTYRNFVIDGTVDVVRKVRG